MSTTKSTESGKTFTVVEPMTDDGTMTVEAAATGEELEIVGYVDELVRERAKTLSPGSSVRLEVTPIAGEAPACTLMRLLPGTPLTPFAAD